MRKLCPSNFGLCPLVLFCVSVEVVTLFALKPKLGKWFFSNVGSDVVSSTMCSQLLAFATDI